MMNRVHRATAAAALLLGGFLVACTPSPEPALGLVRAADGGITAWVAVCEDATVLSLAVYSQSERDESWSVSAPSSAPPQTRLAFVSFTVFETPPGWTADETGLTELRPGVDYGARAGILRGPKTVLRFRPEDLDERPDRVLTGVLKEIQVVSMADFRKRAAKTCR